MFTYCLNNPVNGCDPCGTCFHRLDFWNDCDKCGGKSIRDKWEDVTAWCVDAYDSVNGVRQQQTQVETQIITQQNQMIADAAGALWDAYEHSIELDAQVRYEQDIAMREFITDRFSTYQKTSNTLAFVAAAGGLGFEVYACYAAGAAAVAAGTSVAAAVAAPVTGAIFAGIGLLAVTYAILAE